MKTRKIVSLSVLLAAITALAAFYFLQSPEPALRVPESPATEKKRKTPYESRFPSPTPSETVKTPRPVETKTVPAIQPSFEVSTFDSKIRSSDIPVPTGARVPAVLMDGGAPDDSPETQNILNGIVEEFAEKIEQAKRTNRNLQEAWEEAREAADDRYRFFFGFDAFNAATLESAGEASEEVGSSSTSGAP